MTMSLIGILITGLVGYVWATRGFYAALIHMICTLIAGAIAFAVWEPIAYALLQAAPRGGTGAFIEGIAWGVSLGVPFALALAVLRTAVDSVLRANIIVSTPVNYIGGGLCGAVCGIITGGILVISVGGLRLGTAFLGHQPFQYENSGNLVRGGGLIFPVDRFTANFYGSLSERALATAEPLARWQPNAHEVGPVLRMSYGEGNSRNTLRPEDVALVSRFAVTGPLDKILEDRWNTSSQIVTDPDGNPFPPDSRIEGFVLNVLASGGEGTGKIIFGAGQVRLVCENADGSGRLALFPIAVSSQAAAERAGYGRWRFDAVDTFISSVGGGAEALFAFEFVIPADFAPTALYVKGTRIRIDPEQPPARTFTSAASRDAALTNLSALASGVGGGGVGPIDASGAFEVRYVLPESPAGITMGAAIGFVIQKGLHGSLDLSDEENKPSKVLGGEATWPSVDLQNASAGLERALRIDSFVVDSDVALVHVDVAGLSETNPKSLLSRIPANADRSEGIVLVDTEGQRYAPIGYVETDDVNTTIVYKPGEPILSLEGLPRLSRSRPQQRLELIFRTSKGVSIRYMAAGNKAYVEFKPPLSTGDF